MGKPNDKSRATETDDSEEVQSPKKVNLYSTEVDLLSIKQMYVRILIVILLGAYLLWYQEIPNLMANNSGPIRREEHPMLFGGMFIFFIYALIYNVYYLVSKLRALTRQ